jgi:hypothetical protein
LSVALDLHHQLLERVLHDAGLVRLVDALVPHRHQALETLAQAGATVAVHQRVRTLRRRQRRAQTVELEQQVVLGLDAQAPHRFRHGRVARQRIDVGQRIELLRQHDAQVRHALLALVGVQQQAPVVGLGLIVVLHRHRAALAALLHERRLEIAQLALGLVQPIAVDLRLAAGELEELAELVHALALHLVDELRVMTLARR